MISTAGPTGCSVVRLTANLQGAEDEGWYCPRVTWTFPDGTDHIQEEDCPPFERRNECIESQAGCGVVGFRLKPDGTYEDVVKECPCTIIGYPRRWTIPVCAPTNENDGGKWQVGVRLSKLDRTLATGTQDFYVK